MTTFKTFAPAVIEIDGLELIDFIRCGAGYNLYFTGPDDFDIEAVEAKGIYLKRK